MIENASESFMVHGPTAPMLTHHMHSRRCGSEKNLVPRGPPGSNTDFAKEGMKALMGLQAQAAKARTKVPPSTF